MVCSRSLNNVSLNTLYRQKLLKGGSSNDRKPEESDVGLGFGRGLVLASVSKGPLLIASEVVLPVRVAKGRGRGGGGLGERGILLKYIAGLRARGGRINGTMVNSSCTIIGMSDTLEDSLRELTHSITAVLFLHEASLTCFGTLNHIRPPCLMAPGRPAERHQYPRCYGAGIFRWYFESYCMET